MNKLNPDKITHRSRHSSRNILLEKSDLRNKSDTNECVVRRRKSSSTEIFKTFKKMPSTKKSGEFTDVKKLTLQKSNASSISYQLDEEDELLAELPKRSTQKRRVNIV